MGTIAQKAMSLASRIADTISDDDEMNALSDAYAKEMMVKAGLTIPNLTDEESPIDLVYHTFVAEFTNQVVAEIGRKLNTMH